MRDPKRIKRILSMLGAAWNTFPDLRLCQFIQNLTGQDDNFYFEDDNLEEHLKEFLRTSKFKSQEVTEDNNDKYEKNR